MAPFRATLKAGRQGPEVISEQMACVALQTRELWTSLPGLDCPRRCRCFLPWLGLYRSGASQHHLSF